jgi:hypothetical protein
MRRKALLIGGPGNKGESGYLEGVLVDLSNYRTFLTSDIGGAWRDDEITTIQNPDQNTVRAELAALGLVEYSFVLFGGHGYIDGRTGRTRVLLRKNVELEADELRVGAQRHAVIIDACREIETGLLVEALTKRAEEGPTTNRPACREAFDAQVKKCGAGSTVLWSCSPNETAGDNSATGGYYSEGLILSAREWARSRATGQTRATGILALDTAHDSAAQKVQRISRNLQNPTIEKPRSLNQLPFAVIA